MGVVGEGVSRGICASGRGWRPRLTLASTICVLTCRPNKGKQQLQATKIDIGNTYPPHAFVVPSWAPGVDPACCSPLGSTAGHGSGPYNEAF